MSLSEWPEPHLVGVVDSLGQAASANVRPDPKHEDAYATFSAAERVALVQQIVDTIDIERRCTVLVVPRFDRPLGADFHRAVGQPFVRCTTDKDEGDDRKAGRWKSRGDDVRVLRLQEKVLTSTEIRGLLLDDTAWQILIPEECHEYFKSIDGPARLHKAARDISALG